MAKKKRHRKTRKQKLARANQNRVQQVNTPAIDKGIELEEIDVKKGKPEKTVHNQEPSTDSVDYVRKDVKSSLILAGIIIAIFGVIYFILSATPLGPQVYSIIKL